MERLESASGGLPPLPPRPCERTRAFVCLFTRHGTRVVFSSLRGLRGRDCLSMLSAGGSLRQTLWVCYWPPRGLGKTGFLSTRTCSPSNPRLSSGLWEETGAGALDIPGRRGARGQPKWARGCWRSCKKLITEVTSSGSMEVEGRLTYYKLFSK